MLVQYNQDKTAVRICGDYSIQAVELSTDVLDSYFDGDVELAFHTLKSWRMRNRLANMGFFDASNLKYTLDNIERNERHWQWVSLTKDGHNLYWGYAHKIGDTYHFCDGTVV